MEPKVQTLAQSRAALDPAFAEQRSLIEEQIGGLGAASDIRRQRLEGARVGAYDSIRDAATAMGVSFGGFSPEEQSRYLAGTFLPGMQEIELQEGQERMQLRGQIAQLNAQQHTAALSRIDQQQSALNQWNLQQAQIEAQRREAEIQRQFQAEQNRLDRAHQSSMAAANRAASAPQGPSPNVTAISNALRSATGKDGFVSPGTFRAQQLKWMEQGGTPDSFISAFGAYVNPVHQERWGGYY